MDQLLSILEVTGTTSLGKTSIYLMMRDNRFPKPVQLSPRRVAWRASDVQSWIAEQARKQPNPPIAA